MFMKIQDLQLYRLQIPLKIRFSQSNNTTSISDSTILQLSTQSGITSYGECCPRPYVTGEDFDSVVKDFSKIMDELRQIDLSSLKQIQLLLTENLPSKIGLSSICALELALLDAWSKEQQQPLTSILGIKLPKKINYTGVIPISTPQKLAALAKRFNVFQFKEIKLKVGTDLDKSLESLAICKKYFTTAQIFRADANGAWTLEDAYRLIPKLKEAGFQTLEQPFPKGKENTMAKITKEFGESCRIMADESLTSYDSALQLIENQACNRLNIKLSKTGGIFNALKIYQLAEEHKIDCQLGAHFGETSLLTAAGILFSALAPNLHAYEGAMGEILLEEDLAQKSIQFDFNAEVSHLEEIFKNIGLGYNNIRASLLSNT